jgi:hypothetical protein
MVTDPAKRTRSMRYSLGLGGYMYGRAYACCGILGAYQRKRIMVNCILRRGMYSIHSFTTYSIHTLDTDYYYTHPCSTHSVYSRIYTTLQQCTCNQTYNTTANTFVIHCNCKPVRRRMAAQHRSACQSTVCLNAAHWHSYWLALVALLPRQLRLLSHASTVKCVTTAVIVCHIAGASCVRSFDQPCPSLSCSTNVYSQR